MRAVLRGLELDLHPRTLPAEPKGFAFGSASSSDLTIVEGQRSVRSGCVQSWSVSQNCEKEGFFPGFHHLIVRPEDYDEPEAPEVIEN